MTAGAGVRPSPGLAGPPACQRSDIALGGGECRRGVVRYHCCQLTAMCAREPGDRYPCCRKAVRIRPESIWSVGLRVVPFTFVPVSARVPACQWSARRWVIETRYGWLNGWPCGLSPFAVQIRLSVGCRPARRRSHRPKADRDTPDLGGRRGTETRRSNGWKRRETGDFLTRHWMPRKRECPWGVRELDSRNTTGRRRLGCPRSSS